jgi:Protein of unknown function (DUF2971)
MDDQSSEQQTRWFVPGPVELVNTLTLTSRGHEADQLLYHYTTAEILLENILPERQLRLGLYSNMRDPHENREPSVGLEYGAPPSSDHMPLTEVRELLRDIRGQARVLSMSMDAADYPLPEQGIFARGYSRPRMWEQYAASHHGACLAFSARCLTQSFYKRLREGGAPTCGPVRYSEAGVATSPARTIQADELTVGQAGRVISAHLMEHHWDFWFLKQEDWSQEYEFRFVKFDPLVDSATPIHVPYGDCLKAVILGEKFDPDGVDLTKQLAQPLGVKVLQLDWQLGWPNPVMI